LPLSNVSVAFSRVTARGEPNPERHPLWLAASSAGADVSAEVCETSDGKRTKKTTHVVARGDLGEGKTNYSYARTEKMEWARRNGVNAVDAEWLARCAEEWRAVDEAPYSLFSDASNLKEEEATPRDKRGASPGVSA
jgi:hypothetical protein